MKGRAWVIEMRDGMLFVGRKNSFYEKFWFELGFLADGSFGIKHIRWNGEKGRLPRFPKCVSEKLREIGFKKFEHTDGTIHRI